MINLKSYISKQHKEKDLTTFFDEVYVQSEPLGVVLVIGKCIFSIKLISLIFKFFNNQEHGIIQFKLRCVL